jgi:hypothetical protein
MKTKKDKARQKRWMDRECTSYIGLDVEKEIMNVLAQEIGHDLDADILQKLRKSKNSK